MSIFRTTIETEDGLVHHVEVVYNYTRPRLATQIDPPDGGIEIYSVSCDTLDLTPAQILYVEDKCVNDVWWFHRNGGYSE